MLIKTSVQEFIKTVSEVAIGSEGIIGDLLLLISHWGSDTPHAKNGQELVSTESVEIDNIIASLEVTAVNVAIITEELASIMTTINSGEGTLGKLIHDKSIAKNLDKTMKNLESSSKGIEENMEAA